MGIQGRATLNPYRIAARAVLDRLSWDIRPEATRSRRMLRAWANRYKGESAVILCNGPSLLGTDFSMLKDTFVFGLNKIHLLFDRTDFRPDCIVAVNQLVIEQAAEFYRSTDCPLFLCSSGRRYVRPRPNISYFHSSNIVRFAQDVSISIYQGYTVTFVALQLAYHMGFSRVALTGCDHSFAVEGRPNMTVAAGSVDHSHFDPRYFSGGMNWQLPDLIQSEVSYLLALDAFKSAGRLLCNATSGGKLEVLPRMSLKDFCAGRQ